MAIRTVGVVAKTVAIRSIMFTDTSNKAALLSNGAGEVSALGFGVLRLSWLATGAGQLPLPFARPDSLRVHSYFRIPHLAPLHPPPPLSCGAAGAFAGALCGKRTYRIDLLCREHVGTVDRNGQDASG